MLLDDYLPGFDVRTSCATRIAASPARVYARLWTANFDHWGVTRALYAVRTLPSFPARPRETWRRFRDELFRKRFTLDGMLAEGFALVEERPAQNSCSAQRVAFGVPRENCAQPAQFVPCARPGGNREGGMELLAEARAATLLEMAILRQQSRNVSQPCIVGKRSTVPILRAWPGNRNASGLLSPERPTKRRRSRHPIRCREPARQTPTEHRQ